MKSFSITMIILSLFFLGCEKKQRVVLLKPAPSSNQALHRALDSIQHRDTEALLSLVTGGTESQNIFASTVETFKTSDAFKEKFVTAYGEDAWIAFQTPLPKGKKRPDIRIIIPDIAKIKNDSASWEANDDNQGVFTGLPSFPLTFIKVDGGWVIDGANVIPNDVSYSEFVEELQSFNSFLKKYMKAIGHGNISPEDLDFQMGDDLLTIRLNKVLGTNDDNPNPEKRFDIDDL